MSHCTVHWQRGGAHTLLVMLPGANMSVAQMWDAGMRQTVQQRPQPLDLAWVDTDVRDLPFAGLPTALLTEVLQPARSQYQQVWLGGISLGGQMAVLQTASTPTLVDGLCLLAPYPGSRLVANTVARAGGWDTWLPSEQELQDLDCALWHWFARPPAQLPVFLGWGEQDRFADGIRTLAQRLPAQAANVLPGGHDWAAWLPLWQRFLSGAWI